MYFFFQAEDGIRDVAVTGVQTCALPIWKNRPSFPLATTDGSSWSSGAGTVAARVASTEASEARKSSRYSVVKIGRASCRERVYNSVVAVGYKNKEKVIIAELE